MHRLFLPRPLSGSLNQPVGNGDQTGAMETSNISVGYVRPLVGLGILAVIQKRKSKDAIDDSCVSRQYSVYHKFLYINVTSDK